MTPAINLLQRQQVAHNIHQYEHDPSADSFGDEACQALGLSSKQVFKTLVVKLSSGELAVGVLPVDQQLSMKSIAKNLQVKKASMALPAEVQRSTGYLLGGVSPLAQKKRLATLIDKSAQNFEHIYISAGKRGLEIELSPDDLCELLGARFVKLAN